MPQTIRFHLDEHVDPAVAAGLRARGIDVTTPQELSLLGDDDPFVLAHATAGGRVLFTEDADFLRLNAAGTPHAGIAYCHQQTRSIGEIVRGLTLIWQVLEPDEMSGKVE
jgi:predicted nuclease of predicted toxin-antitoxin system